LPGKDFGFERLLWTTGKTNGIDFSFDGAEKNAKNFARAIVRKPTYCTLTKVSDLSDLMTSSVKTNKYGVGLELLPFDSEKSYNFAWADYCGIPQPKLIQSIIDFLQERNRYCNANKTGFMFYVTFSVGRIDSNGQALKQFDDGGNDKSAKDIIIGGLSKRLNEMGISHKIVMKWRYEGGENYRVHMLTFGIALGKCKNICEIDVNKMISESQGDVNPQGYTACLREMAKNVDMIHVSKKQPVSKHSRTRRVVTSQKIGSPATIEAKDQIEKLANEMLYRFRDEGNGKVNSRLLNNAVFSKMKKRFPEITLQNVSATITTRVVHRSTFCKA
jgi:hypothetical protein